ncbi:DUF397 domain-containing protein [Streptomyces sp. SID625]|nr:DUF397 domain-containing protein [Streptomyces sp. SID625]
MPVSPQPASGPVWFKSSYSGGNATECVECAYTGHSALIRDSKHERSPAVEVRAETWQMFVRALPQPTTRQDDLTR